jgi:hypothetical protein
MTSWLHILWETTEHICQEAAENGSAENHINYEEHSVLNTAKSKIWYSV